MNTNPDYANARKIIPLNTKRFDLSDSELMAAQDQLTTPAMTETRWALIINAACKSFFIKRGLDPGTGDVLPLFLKQRQDNNR